MSTEEKNIDWCTDFPDYIAGEDISGCCRQHDLDYEREWYWKILGDFRMLGCIWSKAVRKFFRSLFLFVGSSIGFLVISTYGWRFWFKYRKEVREAQEEAIKEDAERNKK